LSANGYIADFIEPFYLYIDWGSSGSVSKGSNSKIQIPSIHTKNSDKLKAQTKALLSQFPNTSKVEFVYEDDFQKMPKKKKK
jgi:hypothetical protein